VKIGQWIRRARDDAKWHLIESVVANDAITHCGRRLKDQTGAFELSDVMPLTRMIGQPQLCKRCG
jgi:hypothetical protein